MRIAVPLALLTVAFACSHVTTPAQAAARARVFVASYGNDSNPCTFLSPCKTFQQAVNVVAVGGEVTAIDSAGFGPINITQAVTITSPAGVEAGIVLAPGDTGVNINAGPNDAIVLRGLTLDGGSLLNSSGIQFFSGGSLIVEDCVVRNMQNNGLSFNSTATGSTTETLAVSNSRFYGNSTAGIYITTSSSGTITASINETELENNFIGLFVRGDGGTAPLDVAVKDSVAANNFSSGFLVQSAAGKSATNLTLTHSQVVGNATGVESLAANATLWLAQTTITGNGTGFNASNIINSWGDNYIGDNLANTGSLTPVSRQ